MQTQSVREVKAEAVMINVEAVNEIERLEHEKVELRAEHEKQRDKWRRMLLLAQTQLDGHTSAIVRLKEQLDDVSTHEHYIVKMKRKCVLQHFCFQNLILFGEDTLIRKTFF